MISRIASLLRIKEPVLDDSGLLLASGSTVPSDGDSGYQPGCIFQDTANGDIYINEGTAASCEFNMAAALTDAQEALLGATAGTVSASKAVIVDSSKDVTGFRNVTLTGLLTAATATLSGLLTGVTALFSGAITSTVGAATAAVAARLGASTDEGLEIKVYDEVVTLTNAATDDTGAVIPAGAVILSVQGNLETAVTGDGTGDDLLADIGIGISGGDEDAYAEFGALTKNSKADGIPDWAVNSGETLAIFGLKSDGDTAATEKFTAGGEVRVRVVYAVTNSLDDAA